MTHIAKSWSKFLDERPHTFSGGWSDIVLRDALKYRGFSGGAELR
jgi:hypothetical protein